MNFILIIFIWRKSDEELIRKQVLSKTKVTHSMQQNLLDIYSKRRSNSCGDILEHIYENGECSYCRSGIIAAMVKNRVIREEILRECQFDSYDETRKLAARIIRKRANGN